MQGWTDQDIEMFERMAVELRKVAAEIRARDIAPAQTGDVPAFRLEQYASAIVRDLKVTTG